jgi:hypothetical protein
LQKPGIYCSNDKKNIKVNKLYIKNEKVKAFHHFLRPRSHKYHDNSIVVILVCGEPGGLDGQTGTKAEYIGKSEEGKKVEYHHQT